LHGDARKPRFGTCRAKQDFGFMNALLRFFGLKPSPNALIVDTVYGRIVAASRLPLLYSRFGAADTPLGRFEMLAVHMALLLRAARTASPPAKQLVQEITEEFFKDVDHSLRELGIGDGGVPKRIKKLASMFYGRVDAYARALDDGDEAALATALERNVAPQGRLADARGLAAHVMMLADAIGRQGDEALVCGTVEFSIDGPHKGGRPDACDAFRPALPFVAERRTALRLRRGGRPKRVGRRSRRHGHR
jgi:cytochrome b pre-mRNA-processing protein 3